MNLAVSARLAARVRRDFAPDASAAVLARLEGLDLHLAEKQSPERIQAAVVLLAQGDLAKFEHAAGRAERDWRDVLVWSGLGNNWYPVLDAELGPA